jgi:hypothetical protein
MTRREVLKAVGVVAFGAGLEELFGLPRAFADAPWWEQAPASMAGDANPFKLSEMIELAKGTGNEFPAVAVSPSGKTWITWVSREKENESILLAPFEDGKPGAPVTLSGAPGFAHLPAVAMSGEDVVATWCVFEKPGAWRVRAAIRAADGNIQTLAISEDEGMCWRPAISTDPSGKVWIAWEERANGGKFIIKARRIENGKAGAIVTVSAVADRDNCRPAILALDNGGACVAWDLADGPGDTNIVFRRIGPDGRPSGDELVITRAGGFDIAPALARGPKSRVWLAWHTNRWEDSAIDIPRRIELRAIDGSKVLKPKVDAPGVERETKSTVQGFEFVRLVPRADGGVWVAGRASQNFYLQSFSPAGWSPIYRLPKDGWGGRGQRLETAAGKDGALVTARRDLSVAVAQVVNPEPGTASRAGQEFPLVADVPASAKAASQPVLRRVDFEPWGDNKYYFGDLHGHTWMSDGTGDVDEYYAGRRDYYAMDFAALTDHDTFVGNSITPSEWEHMKEITAHFNEPGRFATLFGQEWTTLRVPKGGGHFNVYSTRHDVPLLDHMNPEFETAQKLIARAKELGAIAIPHHIGWTGTPWEAFDPEVVPAVEIVSVHGAYEFMGNRPISHRGGIKGNFVQDGLARGLKFGMIGGTDCHGLLYQHGVCWKRDPFQAGLACVLATELTPEAVLDAVRKRHCYATSGIRVRMLFEINDRIMGEEIEADGPPSVRVDVSSESPIKWIEIVRNNETAHSFGGEGHRSFFTWEDKEAAAGTSCYYLRVTCRDDNMAWSSPIWVTRKA